MKRAAGILGTGLVGLLFVVWSALPAHAQTSTTDTSSTTTTAAPTTTTTGAPPPPDVTVTDANVLSLGMGAFLFMFTCGAAAGRFLFRG